MIKISLRWSFAPKPCRLQKCRESVKLNASSVLLFALKTACCAASIKYVKEISVLVYWFPPSVAILDLFSISFNIRRVWQYEEASKAQESWKRYSYLKMRALRPVSVVFGDWFHVPRKTKISFYNCIVDRTINGILPTQWMEFYLPNTYTK